MNNVNFESYNDNTTHIIGKGVIQVIESSKEASEELFRWFGNNQMKANPDKCHLITSSCDEMSIYVENYYIKLSKCENFWALTLTTN